MNRQVCRRICLASAPGGCMLASAIPSVELQVLRIKGKIGCLSETEDILASLSRSVFLALSGVLPRESLFRPSLADVVSGRFIQTYFHSLRSLDSEQ